MISFRQRVDLTKEMRFSAAVVLFLIAVSALAEGFSQDYYRGKFIDYPETDYKGVFIPCGTGEVWSIVQNDNYLEMLAIYRNSPLSEQGALYFELQGEVVPIDMVQYPQSHLSAFFTITEIIDHSSNEALIGQCANGQ